VLEAHFGLIRLLRAQSQSGSETLAGRLKKRVPLLLRASVINLR
jgi:hypothetical protein